MPHLILEYTQNLAAVLHPIETLKRLADVMLASGQFQAADIKGRAIRLDEAIVGSGGEPSFLHLKVCLLTGRAEDVRAALSGELLAALKKELAGTAAQITVDIAEMTRATYAKETVG